MGPEDGGMSPTNDSLCLMLVALRSTRVWYTKGWYVAACAETNVPCNHGCARRLEALKKLVGCGE
jgi:hypothetical protein